MTLQGPHSQVPLLPRAAGGREGPCLAPQHLNNVLDTLGGLGISVGVIADIPAGSAVLRALVIPFSRKPANDLGPGLGGQDRHQLHFTEEETEARRNFMCQDCPRQLGSQWSADQAQHKLLEGEASVVCALSSPPPGVGVRGHSLTVSSLSQAGSQQTWTEHPPWLAGAVLGARGGEVNMAA